MPTKPETKLKTKPHPPAEYANRGRKLEQPVERAPLQDDLPAPDTLQQVDVLRTRSGTRLPAQDMVAVETPVALEYNGISHVVMLASPADLQDFALGFSLTEGILAAASELYDCEVVTQPEGITVKLQVAASRFAALKEKRRNLTGRTGCGLCGTESLAQVVRRPAPVSHQGTIAGAALLAGMQSMQSLQPLQQQCGATHAAAWMQADGKVDLVREDVGRHNALDKLIGALAARGTDFSQGAVLLTSRASYEMVQKSAAMGIGVVAAISAPTSLAVQLAQESGVTLLGFVRDNGYVAYSHAARITP